MNARAVTTILRKELLETARDRRALLLMIAVPVVLYPALLLILTQVAGAQKERLESLSARVELDGSHCPVPVIEALRAEEDIEVLAGVGLLEEGAAQRVLGGDVDAALLCPEGARARLEAREELALTLLFDAASERSTQARERLAGVLLRLTEQLRRERLEEHGLGAGYALPLEMESRNIAPPARMGGHVLGMVLPVLLVLAVILGAYHPAVDLTAGEKERGTLQTLLVAPVGPLDIVAGKYLAVCCVAFVTGVVNVGSMALVFSHAMSFGGADLDLDLTFSGQALVILFAAVVVLGLFFSALLMTVAVLARSYKEAQSYIMPVYLLSIVPVMLSQLPGTTLGGVTSLVPALNLALLIREALKEQVVGQEVFLVLVSSLVYTVVVLSAAARVFQREAVLLGGKGALRAVLSLERGRPALTPSPGQAFALFGLLFVLLYYLGSSLQAWNLYGGLLVTLWGLLGLTTLGVARLWRLSFRATFSWRRPPLRGLLAALLLGLAAWAPTMAVVEPLQSSFLPLPKDLAESMTNLLAAPEGWWGQVLLFLAVSVSPAVCEELVFRGFVLSALRRAVPGWAAVLLSALLFAVFHLSIYRVLGTFVLGAIAGLLVLRTGSLVPGMLFHGLNNAILLVLAGPLSDSRWIATEAGRPTWSFLLIGASCCAVGLLLLRRPFRPARRSD